MIKDACQKCGDKTNILRIVRISNGEKNNENLPLPIEKISYVAGQPLFYRVKLCSECHSYWINCLKNWFEL